MALSTTQYGYIIDPMVPFTDEKGKTIKNGFVRVFVAGSSTPVVTYRNFDGATNTDRIELDNSGRTMTNVIGSKGLTYKVCVYDQHHSQESPILTVDKVSVIGTNIMAGAGATVITGLDGLTTKPDGFVDASVVGTDGYVALDHTLVTDDLNTDAKGDAVENERYVPLLNNDVNDPDSKMTLGRLWQWVLGKIKSLSTTITAFRTGDVIPVDGPDGTAKMSKDDLLRETAENALGSINQLTQTATEVDLVTGRYFVLDGTVGPTKLPAENVAKRSIQDHIVASIENEFSTDINYVFGNKVQYNGSFYIFTKDHPAGAWTGTDVYNIPFALKADTIFDYSTVSLTGISEVGNIGTIVKKDIDVSIGTTITVTIPSPTWNVSNIPDSDGYCFICGYTDANGVGHDVKIYTSNILPDHAGETITLPVGYTRYYVCMRGNTGEVATFFITATGSLINTIKAESRTFSRSGTVRVTGAGNMQQVVQIPLYGSAKVSIDIPSVYPVSSIWGPANVYEVGYYTEVTEIVTGRNIPRQYVENINANDISSWAGTTRTFQVPDSTKSLYLFIRCDLGVELEFGYTIEQDTGVGIGNNDASIRELQLAGSAENVDDNDATLYNFVDLRSSDTLSVSESDFPSSMKRLSDKYILARPILRNIGGLNWGSGFCIAPDGKVLCACYSGSNHVIGVADLYNPQFKNFYKSVNGGSVVHSNYMWFDTEKYDAGDLYPLLYIGGNDSSSESNTCNVIRIVGDLKSSETCSFVLVQTITFDTQFGIVADVRKWGDKLVAIYGNKIWICSDFPSIIDGSSVTISHSDVETFYEITGLTFPTPIQSGCIVGDKVYYICGSGTTSYLIVVNLNDGNAVQTKMPNYGEWETLSYFNDIFFAMTISRNENLVAQEMIVCSLEFTFGQNGI